MGAPPFTKKQVTMALIPSVSTEKSKKSDEEIQSVLDKAEYTCACCGVQSAPNAEAELLEEKRGFMYLVVDDEGNEKVVCTICYYTMNMDMLIKPKFIYYPWLSQEQINYMLHLLYTVNVVKVIDAHTAKASKYFLKLCTYSTHLSKYDPSLVNDPLKLIRLMSWLKMEEPESYRLRQDKYLKGIRLIPFSLPVEEQADLKAVFEYSGVLMHQEKMEDKWREIYLNHVKNRQQGISA